LCVEQKYVNQLGLLLFLVNEPISSLSLKLNEYLGIYSQIATCGFYSHVLYIWLVLYEVRI